MNRFFYISPLVHQTFVWPIARPMFRFFLHLKIKGVERLDRLPRGKGIIFATNHTSELDPILVPVSLPFLSPFMPIFYTSREQSFYKRSGWRQFFYGGLLFKLWGSHSVKSGHKDYGVSLATHILLLKNGKSLCIFPEGRQSRDGSLGEAHGGVAFLSHTTGSPVVPVAIKGVLKLTMREFLCRTRHAEIIFGEPLYPRDLVSVSTPDVSSYKTGATLVLKKIAELL